MMGSTYNELRKSWVGVCETLEFLVSVNWLEVFKCCLTASGIKYAFHDSSDSFFANLPSSFAKIICDVFVAHVMSDVTSSMRTALNLLKDLASHEVNRYQGLISKELGETL